jgi:tetratricopeptide (TPR) repeat protein
VGCRLSLRENDWVNAFAPGLLRKTPTTDSLAAASSALFLFRLASPRVALALLVLLWLSSSAASGQKSEQQIEQYFRSGQQALHQGEFARAAENFKKVLALDPTLTEAEVNLGLAYQGLLDYDSAVRHLAKALKERPSLAGPTLIVGLDYLKLGSPEKAIPFLERAVKLDPSNRYAHEALAASYLNQENFRSAADQFRQIAELNPDKAEAWFKLGHEYLDLAARFAYRGARLYRESAWGHRFLGDLYFQRSHWADAIAEYQKALSTEPKQLGLHTLVGQAYLRSQKFGQADKEFRLELEFDPRDELAWVGLASFGLSTDDPKGALECLEKVWQISPEFLVLTRDFPSAKIPQESAKASLLVVQREPEGAAKHYLLAALSVSAGEASSADREWKSFQDEFSEWQSANQTAVRKDEAPCAAHRYARCIDSLKAHSSLTVSERLLLGKAYFAMQQYGPAAVTLERMPEATGESAQASYWLERSYQALGAETYARLEESFPNSWRTQQLRAEDAALRGNVNDAVKRYQAALALRPNEPELHAALGQLHLEDHTYDAAESELARALALDASSMHTLYLLGRLYVETKDNEKAVPYLEHALRLQPELAEANSLLGTAYLRLGRAADAVPRLQKAAPSDHYGNVHYQLYVAYRKLGNSELAQKEFARSQDLRQNKLVQDQALVMGSPRQDVEQQ